MEQKHVPNTGSHGGEALNRLEHPKSVRDGFAAGEHAGSINPAEASRRALVAGREYLEVSEFAGHWRDFGLGALTPQAIALVQELAVRERRGIVSIFAGLGYAEQQLSSAGIDVVAYDKVVPEGRWFGPLLQGGMESVAAHADRMLFMSFPDRGESPRPALDAYLSAGGAVVIVVTEAREDRHMFGSTPDLYEALALGRLEAQVELERWPTIVAPRVPSPAGFHPVMRIYRFGR